MKGETAADLKIKGKNEVTTSAEVIQIHVRVESVLIVIEIPDDFNYDPFQQKVREVRMSDDESYGIREDRRAIAEVLPGFTIRPLGEKETPLESFLLIKLLDAEGEISWSFRTTSNVNEEELLGALSIQVEVLTQRLAQAWDEG